MFWSLLMSFEYFFYDQGSLIIFDLTILVSLHRVLQGLREPQAQLVRKVKEDLEESPVLLALLDLQERE